MQNYKKILKNANIYAKYFEISEKSCIFAPSFWRIYTIRIIPLWKHPKGHVSFRAYMSLFFIQLWKRFLAYFSLSEKSHFMHICSSPCARTNLAPLSRHCDFHSQDKPHVVILKIVVAKWQSGKVLYHVIRTFSTTLPTLPLCHLIKTCLFF